MSPVSDLSPLTRSSQALNSIYFYLSLPHRTPRSKPVRGPLCRRSDLNIGIRSSLLTAFVRLWFTAARLCLTKPRLRPSTPDYGLAAARLGPAVAGYVLATARYGQLQPATVQLRPATSVCVSSRRNRPEKQAAHGGTCGRLLYSASVSARTAGFQAGKYDQPRQTSLDRA